MVINGYDLDAVCLNNCNKILVILCFARLFFSFYCPLFSLQ